MKQLLKGQLAAVWLLLMAALLDSNRGQTIEECVQDFKQGREDFILDADESVKEGAIYIDTPKLDRYRDCVGACCKDTRCNVAFMERGAEEGSINSCFLFDCLYKKKYVCRFVRKKGYLNFIRDSVYESYLAVDVPPNESDRPPVADAGPDRVVQPQDMVTLNGHKSRDDVGITSYLWTMITLYPFAVIEKTNFDDQIIVSNLTSGVYKFQLTVTDSSGQSDSTQITVLVLTPEQSEHHCMAPMKIGPCRGSFPRWHYNAASEKCEKFDFGGCRENLNNYLSKDECDNACSGSDKLGKSGRLLPLPGTQTEKCGDPCTAEQFTCANGCCLDRGLECDSTPQCSDGSDEQSCSDLNENFKRLLQIPVDERKVRCTEAPDTGTCRDTITKWYYNPFKEECTPFNYGGCQGNENRFDSREQCSKFCRGVTDKDVFARNAEFERMESGSKTGVLVALAVLGVAIFIMLGVILYCFMKGRRKSSQHQRVPVNTLPVTYEDREHLVYNTTTKAM